MDIRAIDVLQTYGLGSLQQMARQRDLETQKQNKGTVVPMLARAVVAPNAIKASLDDLTSLERLVLDRVILAGGNAMTETIRRSLEREDRIDRRTGPERDGYTAYWSQQQEKGSARNRGSRKFEDLIARLGALGLVFTAEPVYSGGTTVELSQPGRRLLIPDEILRTLPPVTLAPEPAATPETDWDGDPAPLLRDIYLLLSFAAREPIPLTARGMIPKRSLTRIDAALQDPEGTGDVRSEDEMTWLPFLRALAEEVGALVTGPGELLLDERADAFLALSSAARQQRLYDAYRQTTRWNELFRIPNLTIRGKGASIRTAPAGVVEARRRVMSELAQMPSGEWLSLDGFIQRLRLRDYEFLLSRQWTPESVYRYGYYGAADRWILNPYAIANRLGLTFDVAGEEAGWDTVEAGFIRSVVTEALYSLGVVDLGRADGTLSAFRVTADGFRLLHGETLPERPSEPHVVIQPNFQIFAMPPTGEDVLFRLDQMADRLRVDQATEYELTRDSIYRAQRAGLDTAAVLAFLESVSSVGLPPNVRRSIEEWGMQHERVTVRRRTPLLHVQDAQTLDSLYADPALAALLGRRVTPTVALVPPRALQPLLDLLVQRELLPALSEGPEESPAPLLVAGSDGVLTYQQPLPSIFDLSPLTTFSEDVEGGIRVTQASLRRGARAGLSADDIIAILTRLHAGPLPAEVTALVRRWAKDWGQGALVEATILQVEHPETLADLLADPELRPALTRVPGAPRLALVLPSAVERVRALLNERGMALGDRLLN